MRNLTRTRRLQLIALSLFSFSACTTIPAVKTPAYAPLQQERMFEYSFPRVWRAIQDVASKYKILRMTSQPPVTKESQIEDQSEGKIETDWSYSQSRDKYEEYQIDGSPRKVHLQSRFKYVIVATRVLGGTQVEIKTEEEIEKVKARGASDGFTRTLNVDSSRAAELLDKINIAILSAQSDSN